MLLLAHAPVLRGFKKVQGIFKGFQGFSRDFMKLLRDVQGILKEFSGGFQVVFNEYSRE